MTIQVATKDNLLTLIGRACSELGLVAPSVVVGNLDQQIVQFLALATREGREQYSMATPIGGWQVQRQEYVFAMQSSGILLGCSITSGSNIVTVPAGNNIAIGWVVSNSGASNASGFTYPTTVAQIVDATHVRVSNASTVTNTNISLAFGQDTYPLPADYDHMIPQTQWDRGFRWQLLGPMSPQEWQVLKSGLSPTGPRRRFRLIDGAFVVDPVPYDTNQLVFEYYSTNWVQAAGTGVSQRQFLADTDYFMLDDDAFVMGVIWRFRRAKGLDYDEEKNSWENRIELMKGRQAGERSLPLNANAGGVRLLNNQNVPDTGFGT